MSDKKNILIVYAHQEPKSFNGALKDIAVETLQSQGHSVNVSDLYNMRFDPVASKHGFKDIQNKDRFNFQQELKHAAANGTLQDDIKSELDKILAADLIILQFPMYWLGMPAILKGWIDRCLAENVAFDTMKFRWFDNGPFANKKIMLSFTTGGSASFFSKAGLFGDMDVILWPIQNTLRFTGFKVLAPNICYSPADVSENERTCMLDAWKDRLQNICTEEPLKFIHIDQFDEENGFQLSEKYIEDNNNSVKIAPNVGQNMGLPVPEGCMTKQPESYGKHGNL